MRIFQTAVWPVAGILLACIMPLWCADYSWVEDFTNPADYTVSASAGVSSIRPNMSRGTWTLRGWTSFSETADKPAGTDVKYQFSFDDGATWHYYTGRGWAPASGPADGNTAAQLTSTVMQAVYPGYAPASAPLCQKILWRAFLVSHGAAAPKLTNVTIKYRQAEATFWEWGGGAYRFPAPADPDRHDAKTLDGARWDWMTVSFAADYAYWDGINAQLAMNPNQKLVVDLNFVNGAGWGNADRCCTANMFDYRYSKYKSGAKEGLKQLVRDRVDTVLNRCDPSRIKNIAGFTLMEEIYAHWGLMGDIATDSSVMPPILKEYKAEIEKERGKPLVWNEETKLWCGRLFVETLRDLHMVLKEEIADTTRHPAVSDMKVYFWDGGAFYLDDTEYLNCIHPAGWTIWTPGIYPVTNQADLLFSAAGERLVDVRLVDNTGSCGPNDPAGAALVKAGLYHANKYNTLFVMHANHPSANRRSSWADILNNCKINQPLNLGYWFYCAGICNNYPGDYPPQRDPNYSTDPADNVPYASCADHGRNHGARQNIGMDIVRRELSPFPSVGISVSGQAPGTVTPLTVLLENPAAADYFTSADQAAATNVNLALTLPAGCVLDPGHAGQSLTWNVGNMAAQSWRKKVWWVKINGKLTNPATTVKVSSSNRPAVTKTFTGDSTIPSFLTHYIRRPSKTWVESIIGESSTVDIAASFDALDPTDRPSLTIGSDTITYDTILQPGQKIVYSTWNNQARMYNGTLFQAQIGESDPNDPTGYKPFTTDQGRVVKNPGVFRNVTGLTKLKVTVDGKVAGGAASQMDLYFLIPPSTIQTVTCLTGLGADWSTQSEIISVPANAAQLYSMVFCRWTQTGSVWYGTARIDNATYPDTGVDVSSTMKGYLPAIPADDFSVVTYRDKGFISIEPKIRVQISQRINAEKGKI